MSPYPLAVYSLSLALFVQFAATCLATLVALRPPYRRSRMAFAIGLGLLALQHALALEMVLYTGIYDLRQSLLAAGVSVLLLLGLLGFSRRQAGTPPPR